MMFISNKKLLEDFIQIHSQARSSLNRWINKVKKEDWKIPADILKSFRTADYVGNGRYVFDISGNNFRLIAVILFSTGVVEIRYIGTHSDYDKIKTCSEV